MAANSATIASVPKPKSNVDPTTWKLVQQFMLRHCGVVLRDDQVYLAESRLSAAMKQHGCATLNDFVTAACRGAAGAPAAKSLIDAMTTHETMFYRDAQFWQTFEGPVIKELAQRVRGGARARIWSAACSTGQEPYSIAMMLEERAPEIAAQVDIVATDVAELSVARAREGVFTALEVNRNLNATRLMRHFVQSPGGFKVRDELRSRVQFHVHNLLGANPDPMNCDVVLCRNVLIYFGDTDRTAALRRLAAAALPAGFIGLGSTESWREARTIAPGWFHKPA